MEEGKSLKLGKKCGVRATEGNIGKRATCVFIRCLPNSFELMSCLTS